MLVYPVLATGVAAQYPAAKTLKQRTTINTTPDGRTIKFSDTAASTVEWKLEYTALSDDERTALEDFFVQTEGCLNSFVFVDPVGNLLASSEALTAAVWEKGSLLTVEEGTALATRKTFNLHNTGSGSQTLQQTLEAPAGYTYTFSVYAMGTVSAPVTVFLGTQRLDVTPGSDWSRSAVSAQATEGTALLCGIEVPAGSTVSISGVQLEPQASPSAYRPSGDASGIYEAARFNTDAIQITTDGPNRHSCTVNIIHVNHL
jgi:hypothetical protein